MMQVIKRNGNREAVKFEKISKRITRASKDLKYVDPAIVTQSVVAGLYDGVTTVELDKLASETAYSLATTHPEYDKLAARLAISALHKVTETSFSQCIKQLNESMDPFGNPKAMIDPELTVFIEKHAHILDAAIDHEKDFGYDFFGFSTLKKSYLLKSFNFVNGKLVSLIRERPQFMLMRIATAMYCGDIDGALSAYELLASKSCTMATPTCFNSGLKRATDADPRGANQLSSCFLLGMEEDSIHGIYNTLATCAQLSRFAGGIGVWASNIRASGSPVYGTNGISNGLVPMLKVFNETARYVDQGGGKRRAGIAAYISIHHTDVEAFMELRKGGGKEEARCRDLNLAIWAPDLFFQRVEEDKDWTLMCPNKCPGLEDVYGEQFVTLYEKYENENRGDKTVSARKLLQHLILAQIESGMPYLLAKDRCNAMSNQRNLYDVKYGAKKQSAIKSSNLCIDGEALIRVKKDLNVNSEEFLLTMSEVNDLLKSQDLYVFSYNEESGKKMYSKILSSSLTNKSAEVIEIIFNEKSLICTPDHKIFTKNRGYVEAQNLREDDVLLEM